jgi:2',3'-cyclic-nucleotide 2'-phosphodiesterase (5'-nucleotidase family)
VRPDPDLDALVKDAARRVGPLADRVVGHAPRDLDHGAVDRLAVDAQRAFACADVAILHPGTTRADLKRGPITYAEAFEVQAYEHPLLRFRMSGAQLRDALAPQRGCLGPARANSNPTRSAPWSPAEWSPSANPSRGTDREPVGADLEALVAWLPR